MSKILLGVNRSGKTAAFAVERRRTPQSARLSAQDALHELERERAFQAAVFRFLDIALPQDKTIFYSAIPGGDGKVTLAPGYKSGLMDVLLIKRGVAHFIELKTQSGVVSTAQRDCADAVRWAGARHGIARTLLDVENHLRAWDFPLRAEVQ